MQALPDQGAQFNASLRLLLFVDRRPTSREQIRQIQMVLEELAAGMAYDLQVVDVSEQPHLAEHFRLITTPTLIKLAPEPRQALVGSDLIPQLRDCWERWQKDPQDDGILDQEWSNIPDSNEADDDDLIRASEQIKLADEVFRLNQERAELAAQLRFKDQIIAMLAHDLRNPLTAASIALETLDLGMHPKEGQISRLTPALTTQLIRQARSQLKTINGMITDILQAAHGTSAELYIYPQPLALPFLCQEILTDFHDRFQAKSLTVETDIPSDLPKVYADAERIRQVLINLLDNAVKYTSDGGKIHLSALHRTTQKVQVSLRDDGPGIPEDNRGRIFEDHFRLQRDREQSGYGIGLYLCQRIVRAHYGQIWVDSVSGEGSCFHFTLPVYKG
jgi:two-component system, OmpR family, clock-associated histidine kinase SasA